MELENSPKCDNFWGDPPGGGRSVSPSSHGHGHGSHSHSQHLQYERNLNFSTVAIEDSDYGFPRKKTIRDPLSHRIIEKRRRDRMNNCLAHLSRLLPKEALKKGRGRIEKTEIVELAIKHLGHLQCHPCPYSDNCEYNKIPLPRPSSSSHGKSTGSSSSSNSSAGDAAVGGSGGSTGSGEAGNAGPIGSGDASSAASAKLEEQFRLGFQESLSETMHFLVEHEGMYAGDDLCVRLVQHLNGHCENLLRDHVGNNRKLALGFTNSRPSSTFKDRKTGGSLGSISSGYQPNGSSGSGSDGNCANDGDGSINTPFGPKNLFSTHSGQSLTGQGHGSHSHQLALSTALSNGGDTSSLFDYEGDQNSCSSAQLSIEISDAFSQDQDGKMTGRSTTKPPIPTIICSHSSSNNSGSPPVSNSDEGSSVNMIENASSSSASTAHRYNYKKNIKQRFSADLQTEIVVHNSNRSADEAHRGSGGRDSSQESRHRIRIPQPAGLLSPRDRSLENDSPDNYYSKSSPESDKAPSSNSSSEQAVGSTSKVGPDGQSQQEGSSASDSASSSQCQSTNVNNANLRNCKTPLLIDQRTEEIPALSVTSPTASPALLEIVDKKPIVENLLVEIPENLSAHHKKEPQDEKHTDSSYNKGGVPAFALHENGQYYIPLRIDRSIVSPLIAAMDGQSSGHVQRDPEPPLHPITISVRFLLPGEEGGACKKFISDGSGGSGQPIPIPIPVPMAHPPMARSPTVFGPPGPKLSTHRDRSDREHYISNSPSNFIMNRFAQSQVPMVFRSPSTSATVNSRPSASAYHGHYSVGSESGSSHSSSNSASHGHGHGHGHSHGHGHGRSHNSYGHGNGGSSHHNPSGGSGNVNFNSSNYYSMTSSISNANSHSHRSGSGSGSSMSMSMSLSSNAGGSSESGSAASDSVSRSRLSRKRSVSKSPSMSIGYHSWSEKTPGGGGSETCSAYSTDEGIVHGDNGSSASSGSSNGRMTMPILPVSIPTMEPQPHHPSHRHSNPVQSSKGSTVIPMPMVYHMDHLQHPHPHHHVGSMMDHETDGHHPHSHPHQHQHQLSRRDSKGRAADFEPSKRSKKTPRIMDEGNNNNSSGRSTTPHCITSGGGGYTNTVAAASRKSISSN